MATYSAEFCPGRTCVEQVIDFQNSFRYLGVPINDTSMSLVTMRRSSRVHPSHMPDSTRDIIFYHFTLYEVWWLLAFLLCSIFRPRRILQTLYRSIELIILSVWDSIQPVFHHMGNTVNLYIDDDMNFLDRLFEEFFIPCQPLQDGEY